MSSVGIFERVWVGTWIFGPDASRSLISHRKLLSVRTSGFKFRVERLATPEQRMPFALLVDVKPTDPDRHVE